MSVSASTMEMTAVSKTIGRYLGISAATAALALFAYGAQAQTPPPKKEAAPKAAPAKKPPACNSLKEEAACKARDDCEFMSASVDAKTKKVKKKAYCRTKPKPKPAPAPKAEPKKK